MYFLWRNKPHAVLGLNDEWIPKGEIQARLDEVRIFGDAGEARYVQRIKYSKSGVSVLNQKSFKEKVRIKKLPVYRSAPVPAEKQAKDGEGQPSDVNDTVSETSRHLIYGEYLEKLCESDCGQNTRVIFPPSNLEFTTETPVVNGARSILTNLLKCITDLENKEYQLREEIKRLDLLNSDRLHQVEMFELTDEECITFVRALHESQLERRRRKNELLALLAEKDALKRLNKDELKKAIKEIESLGQQEYRCRVLSDSDSSVEGHAKVARTGVDSSA